MMRSLPSAVNVDKGCKSTILSPVVEPSFNLKDPAYVVHPFRVDVIKLLTAVWVLRVIVVTFAQLEDWDKMAEAFKNKYKKVKKTAYLGCMTCGFSIVKIVNILWALSFLSLVFWEDVRCKI